MQSFNRLRTSLHLLYFIAATSSCFAQSYLPFPVSTAKWKVFINHLHVQGNDFHTVKLWVGFEIAGVTMFNGKRWYIVKDYAHLNYDDQTATDNFSHITAYLRTDSTQSQAWMYIDDSTDILVYKISQSVGDSFKVESSFPLCLFGSYSNYCSLICAQKTIHTINTVSIGGINRKRVYAPCPFDQTREPPMVEGIGLLGHEACSDYIDYYDFTTYQYCENGVTLFLDTASVDYWNNWYPYWWQFLTDCDAVVANSPEIAALECSISPNPGSDMCRLQLPRNESFSIAIYSAEGKCIFQDKGIRNNWEWDSRDQPAGMYFFRLSAESGESARIRWIKL